MKFFRTPAPQPPEAEPPADDAVQAAPEPEPTLRPADVGDAGYGQVAASLEFPPGAARDARAEVAARTMEPSTSARSREYWVLEGVDGRPVGSLMLSTDADDPGAVTAFGAVDPVVRRYGMGERLFAHACERARQLGATTLRSFTKDQGGLAFLADHGFTATQTLVVGIAPLAAVADLAADAPAGYDIHVLADELPGSLAEPRARLQEEFARAIPQGDRPGAERWDAARITEWFAHNSRPGVHFIEAVALAGGEPVGFSNVIVYDGRSLASQRDTFVAEAHRGKGLGLALKAATARVVAERFPHVTELRTFVDQSNEHMLAVNDRAGYVATEHHVEASLRVAD